MVCKTHIKNKIIENRHLLFNDIESVNEWQEKIIELSEPYVELIDINFTFLSNEGYTSMEDYIESTKDEFSYKIEEIIPENNNQNFLELFDNNNTSQNITHVA